MIIWGINYSLGRSRQSLILRRRILHSEGRPPAARNLCTKSVDNAVEKDLRRAASRSTRYAEVILVKKPSKSGFRLGYQIVAPLYDDGARGSNPNQSQVRS
jgi:hypothetical protein